MPQILPDDEKWPISYLGQRLQHPRRRLSDNEDDDSGENERGRTIVPESESALLLVGCAGEVNDSYLNPAQLTPR